MPFDQDRYYEALRDREFRLDAWNDIGYDEDTNDERKENEQFSITSD